MPILPKARPNPRATIRDLNSAQVIRVFRKPSFIRRLLQTFAPGALRAKTKR